MKVDHPKQGGRIEYMDNPTCMFEAINMDLIQVYHVLTDYMTPFG